MRFDREHVAVWLVLLSLTFPSTQFFSPLIAAMSQDPSSTTHSDHGGQLVYEVINGVDHQLDIILLGHAVLAVSPEDDVHVRAEDPLTNLHGDVPGDIFIF